MLLFSICEGLMNLIFPFKWLHTYIPSLPQEQMDYLDSPTPYIMGVLSGYVDFDYLRENYPNHIICDVNTSMIYGIPPCTLPSIEEINLRKKIQFIKKPELYEIEDLKDEDIQVGDIFNIEDINPLKSISENIQNVFFRIFFKTLKNLEKLYIRENVFDSKSFLDDIFDEETKNFWEKIINTVAFEFYILSYQYLDDSNTQIFKNILKLEEEERNYNVKNQSCYYAYSMNLQNNINFLIKELENKANIYNNKYLNGYSNISKSPPISTIKPSIQDNFENVNIHTDEYLNKNELFSFEKYKENLHSFKHDYDLVIDKVYQNSKKIFFDENYNYSISNNINGEGSKNNSLRKSSNLRNSRRNFKNLNMNNNNTNNNTINIKTTILNVSNLGSIPSSSNHNSNNIFRSRKRHNHSYDLSQHFNSFKQHEVIEESNMELRPSHVQQSDKYDNVSATQGSYQDLCSSIQGQKSNKNSNGNL